MDIQELTRLALEHMQAFGREEVLNQAATSTDFSGTQHYTDMLNDDDRNKKFFKAIVRAVENKKKETGKVIVLDIGAGTGLLSMMAIVAGADEVYACEMLPWKARCAEKVLRRNGLGDRIHILRKHSTALKVGRHGDMATKANILVAEIFDCQLIGEDAIKTFNDATKRLLQPNAIVIPEYGSMYATLVQSTYVRNLSSLQSIDIVDGKTIKFPKSMASCSGTSNADVDIQLDNFKPGQNFHKISNTLEVFRFNWKEQIPACRTAKTEFVANQDGSMDGVLCWWTLQLDSDPETVISCAPAWAGGVSAEGRAWRYHWRQNLYFGMTPVPVKEGTNCVLYSFHDLKSFWFRPALHTDHTAFQSYSMSALPGNRSCSCTFHQFPISPSRWAQLNDIGRNEKYLQVLKENIIPGKSVCLCFGDFSMIPLMAHALGAKLVLVYLEDKNLSKFLIPVLVENNISRSSLVFFTANQPPRTTGLKVDLIIGDPYFNFTRGMIPTPEYPWYHLKMVVNLRQIEGMVRERKLEICNGTKLIPGRARLMAMAMNFENLDRIKRPVGTKCAGRFDMTAFDETFLKRPETTNSQIDTEYLWQYVGKASSNPTEVFQFCFEVNSDYEVTCYKGFIKLEAESNGISFWMEWDLNADTTISTGPQGSVSIGCPVQWDMHSQQGIYFIPGEQCTPDKNRQFNFWVTFDTKTQYVQFFFE